MALAMPMLWTDSDQMHELIKMQYKSSSEISFYSTFDNIHCFKAALQKIVMLFFILIFSYLSHI